MKFLPLTVILCTFVHLSYGQTDSGFSESIPDTEILSGTYLGNSDRNFYGDKAPDKLDMLWRTHLGKGKTADPRNAGSFLTWYGAGWTCQPATVRHDSTWYLVQPSFGQKLYKINAETGAVIWERAFDDVLKASPTIWENVYNWNQHRLLIIQGSRRGNQKHRASKTVHSLRAVDFFTGEDVWYYNVRQSRSYSRDVDASPLVINDTLYAPLENGHLLVADPLPGCTKPVNGKPEINEIDHIRTYSDEDAIKHRNNVILEGSPTHFNDHLYMCSGTGWLYGYSLITDSIDWAFYTGGDMDGTPPVTSDSCILVTVEKQYIPGQGGVFKLDPRQHPDSAVVWYFPVQDTTVGHWKGGVLGSAVINDYYANDTAQKLAAFNALDGHLYLVNHEFTTGDSVAGPMKQNYYPTPQLVSKHKTGPTIATPIMTENRILVPTYHGLHLFAYDDRCLVKKLDKHDGIFESTPVFLKGKAYIGSKDGYLYCFGKKDAEE